MTTVTQLNPTIPMTTPKGHGQALLVVDYGLEHNLMWTVAIDATGELWTYSNQQVRAAKNITMGRLVGDVKDQPAANALVGAPAEPKAWKGAP